MSRISSSMPGIFTNSLELLIAFITLEGNIGSLKDQLHAKIITYTNLNCVLTFISLKRTNQVFFVAVFLFDFERV